MGVAGMSLMQGSNTCAVWKMEFTLNLSMPNIKQKLYSLEKCNMISKNIKFIAQLFNVKQWIKAEIILTKLYNFI